MSRLGRLCIKYIIEDGDRKIITGVYLRRELPVPRCTDKLTVSLARNVTMNFHLVIDLRQLE
jgi:hypothetical protein